MVMIENSLGLSCDGGVPEKDGGNDMHADVEER